MTKERRKLLVQALDQSEDALIKLQEEPKNLYTHSLILIFRILRILVTEKIHYEDNKGM